MFHYCSFEAFQAIIENRTLWATDSRVLNDPREVEYAKDILANSRDLVMDAIKDLGGAEYVDEAIERALSETAVLYITSFSASPDKLSQWRNYGVDGHGISVGFSSGAFTSAGYVVRRTLYGTKVCEALIEELNASLSKNHSANELKKEAYRIVIELLSSTKPEGFEEEDEVRLTVFRNRVSRPKFRTSPFGLVPYATISLADAWPNVITEVWLGPRRIDPVAKEIVQQFLNENSLEHVTISRSRTVLR